MQRAARLGNVPCRRVSEHSLNCASGRREGCCYHVQAITAVVDQYAEKAPSNRDYLLNKPHGAGWQPIHLGRGVNFFLNIWLR
jgi:hypothetical protein